MSTQLFHLLVAQSVDALSVRQSITALTQNQIGTYKPYTYFASAAFCTPAKVSTWSCGANCNTNSKFIPTITGGDGSEVPYWFVGYDPVLSEVIVSHEGADVSNILAELTDAGFFLTPLDQSLFPGIATAIEVHDGFKQTHSSSAVNVLSAVQQAMATHGATKVTMVGFSLGAALALLDSVYLPLHLPVSTEYKTITYGMPRVGNPAFADYVDTHTTLTHINNKDNPVPTTPGRFLGFAHPAGEVRIQNDDSWDSCPGQDNTSDLCITGAVTNIFEGRTENHDGPYDGVVISC